MKSEVKLIDLGMNALRLTKNGRLTKINKDGDDWSSSNFKDTGEFTVRLDLLIAEDSGEVYSVPAKSATVTLGFDKVTEIADFIKPTAGTAVGGPEIHQRIQRDTACAVIDRLFRSLDKSTFNGMYPKALKELQSYRADMIQDVLKVLKGEL